MSYPRGKPLSKQKKQRLVDLYSSNRPKKEIQEILSKEFGVNPRIIRSYAMEFGLNVMHQHTKDDKVLVYDIETSRINAKVWQTGKQYLGHKNLRGETTIISISWKWVGLDKVYHLTWDKDHNDEEMVAKFLKEYNKANMVIGFNNDNFDNKIISARAMKYRLHISRFVKSYDIYKKAKRACRLESYSMEYMCKYFGLSVQKLKHEGITMWDMIEDGTPKQQKEYLKKMVDYNIGDIVATEELYITLKPYFGTVTHKGVKEGKPKWTCPVSGSTNVKLYDTIFTERGTVQRILYCEDSDHQFKVSNKIYMDYLQRALDTSWQ
jgi:uncharacterized protein YprB with RNaseH-like and TPR domain